MAKEDVRDPAAPPRRLSGEEARFAILAALTALALGLLIRFRGRISVESVQELVRSYGGWSPVVYLALASLLPLAFVPRWLLTAAAGALFGIGRGAVLGLAGGMGGALAGYALGRVLGSPYLEKHGGRRALAMRGFIQRHGFVAVLLGRTNPAISCEAVSLASGIAVVRLPVYVTATALGMAPGSFLYAALGDSIAVNEVTVTFWSLIVLVVMSAVTGIWFWRAWRSDTAADSTKPNG
jgi:uncharacterized membrane protein YdjX (TVP38/TMEM64 family)